MKPYVYGLTALALALSGTATAQSYPVKPVRLVVGFPAGGSVDLVARLVGQRLSEATGKQFIVDNRPGAHGIIAADLVAKAAPDGYTLLIVSGGHSINPSLYKSLPYDTLGDFAAVSSVASYPLLLLAHPSVPAKSVKDLIALARAQPGHLNYASTGPGSPAHLTMELFLQLTAIKMAHIPYKGGAPALADLAAGQVQVMFNNIVVGLPLARRGQLRGLAVSSAKRSSAVPELPTIAEGGMPGFEATTWSGMLAPRRVPRSIVTKLHGEIVRMLQVPAVRDRLRNDGAEIV
ncbi:MAG TPA: tripartite tricarboxylate transporter substrate binding protein, partial [Burkholderiales bacterium]|nr:tripartite tricarboxylate transporter substrate binding protein [Burkholderiales bacterium]